MTVTHPIRTDLVLPGVQPRIYAMQFDSNTRVVELELTAQGEPWLPPEDAAFALSYRKADGTRGYYDQLADGVAAISRKENRISVTLAPQVLTASGMVEAALVVTADDSRMMAFPFQIHVSPDPSGGTEVSDDYFNTRRAEAVLYIPQALTQAQQTQARVNIGAVATVNGIAPDEAGNVDLNAQPEVPTYRFSDPDQVILESYWSVTDTTGTGVAVVRSGADWWATDWCCYSQLIPAHSGDILRFYNYPWENYVSSQIVFMAYTRDKMAFDGGEGRQRPGHGVDHGDYREFTVPENTAYVALNLLHKGDAQVRKKAYVEHISNSPVRNFILGDQTPAQLYQKGAAPKNSHKPMAILCAGQSNAQGRVPRAQLPDYVTLPMENCRFCNNAAGNFVSLSDGYFVSDQWAFDLITYHHLAQNQAFYVIKHAEGGTSMDPTGATDRHWTPFYETLDSQSQSLLRTFEDKIRACREKGDFDIRAMLWHQGEGDADSEVASVKYYYNLRSMIAYIRGVVGDTRLPFICGTVPHASAGYNATVEAALEQLAQEDPYFYLIDLNDAAMLDSWHFDAAWSEYFGKCAYDRLIDAGVITGEKLNPAKPG